MQERKPQSLGCSHRKGGGGKAPSLLTIVGAETDMCGSCPQQHRSQWPGGTDQQAVVQSHSGTLCVCVRVCVCARTGTCAQLLSHVGLFTTLGLLPASPWNFPGENIGVGCHFFFRGIFLTQRSNPRLLHLQANSLPLCHLGSPILPSYLTVISSLGVSGGSVIKKPPVNARGMGLAPGSGRSPGEGKATHSSILAWKIP